MEAKIMTGGQADGVVQFTVFTPNRLGRLHELVQMLGSRNVHVLALMVQDITDSAIIRLVLDDPDQGRELLGEHAFAFVESSVVAVEIDTSEDLPRLTSALLEAEININYLYAFIPHPHEKTMLALNMDDPETAQETLKRHQFTVLKQSDISR